MEKVFVLYGSTRKQGNSVTLTEKIIDGVNTEKVFLLDKRVNPIIDLRHTKEGFTNFHSDDDYRDIIGSMLQHNVLIFSTPLYWYGMSGNMKNFFDRWSQSLKDKDLNFKNQLSGKKAYVVITGGEDPRYEGLPLVEQFANIFKFVGIEFVDYIIGKGNKPNEILQDNLALYHASLINKSLKK
jgi:multimeric flavodoxin WrbA